MQYTQIQFMYREFWGSKFFHKIIINLFTTTTSINQRTNNIFIFLSFPCLQHIHKHRLLLFRLCCSPIKHTRCRPSLLTKVPAHLRLPPANLVLQHIVVFYSPIDGGRLPRAHHVEVLKRDECLQIQQWRHRNQRWEHLWDREMILRLLLLLMLWWGMLVCCCWRWWCGRGMVQHCNREGEREMWNKFALMRRGEDWLIESEFNSNHVPLRNCRSERSGGDCRAHHGGGSSLAGKQHTLRLNQICGSVWWKNHAHRHLASLIWILNLSY